MQRSRDWPIAVRSIDLGNPLAPITGLSRYSRVRVFVSREGRLLGAMDVWNDGAEAVSVGRLRESLADHFGYRVFQERVRGYLAGPEPARPPLPPATVSIVVPTCDRPDDLRRCLASLTTQATRHTIEIIVVDNRPGSGRTPAVLREFPTVRVVEEPRPGLSFARNAGILKANGGIIVATDDDVTAPAGWIESLLEPFADPRVAAVTGNVLPIELESEAQCRFEAYGGLGKGYTRFEVGPTWFASQRCAVPTWNLGATANAAFRAAVFGDSRIGLLDEALGAGTPTGCSEDTYLFYRILKAGHSIVYEPSAYVWHRHRQTMESLRHQIHAYSTGHVAYHLTTWLEDRDSRAFVRLFYSLPKIYARRAWHRLRGYSDYPLSLIALEARGNLAGPWALWRSRRRARRFGPTPAPSSWRPATVPDRSNSRPPEQTHAVPMEGQVSQGPAA